MKLSDHDQYFPFSSVLSLPFCERFIPLRYQPLYYDSTGRLSFDARSQFRIWLRTSGFSVCVIERASIETTADMQRMSQRDLYEHVEQIAAECIAKADYQLAAYCASNLWC